MKQESAFFVEKDFTSPNIPPSNYPRIDRNNGSKSAINESNDYKTESLNEEYSIIQKIWDDLGATYKYQIQFDNYIRTVSEKELRNILINEESNVKRFGKALVKLSKEITLEKIIFNL